MALRKSLSLALLLGSTFSLSHCGYSVDQLAEDTELRNGILKECASMGIKAREEKKCGIAAEAELEAVKRAGQALIDKMKN